MTDVKPIPDGYPQVIPYLSIDDASAAIDKMKVIVESHPDYRFGWASLMECYDTRGQLRQRRHRVLP